MESAIYNCVEPLGFIRKCRHHLLHHRPHHSRLQGIGEEKEDSPLRSGNWDAFTLVCNFNKMAHGIWEKRIGSCEIVTCRYDFAIVKLLVLGSLLMAFKALIPFRLFDCMELYDDFAVVI